MIKRRRWVWLAMGLAIWAAGVVAVGLADGFVVDGPVPWPTVVAVGVPLTVVAVLMRTGRLAALVADLDPRWPVAVQLWRVVGAAFLFGWAADELPAGFAVPAAVGDIATGVAALALLVALDHRTATRRDLVAFTALGLGDFAVAVVAGIALGPVAIEQLPWVLFPTLAVPLFAIAHAVTWTQLDGALGVPAASRPRPRAIDVARPEPVG